jgi:hypothetical protein
MFPKVGAGETAILAGKEVNSMLTRFVSAARLYRAASGGMNC